MLVYLFLHNTHDVYNEIACTKNVLNISSYLHKKVFKKNKIFSIK